MAMRVACAAHSADKKLSIGFEANEIMCLAEILKQQQQGFREIFVDGKTSMTPDWRRCPDSQQDPDDTSLPTLFQPESLML